MKYLILNQENKKSDICTGGGTFMSGKCNRYNNICNIVVSNKNYKEDCGILAYCQPGQVGYSKL